VGGNPPVGSAIFLDKRCTPSDPLFNVHAPACRGNFNRVRPDLAFPSGGASVNSSEVLPAPISGPSWEISISADRMAVDTKFFLP